MAAARIDRQRSTQFYSATLNPIGRLADWREAKTLQRPQYMRHEAVVAMKDVYIGRHHPSRFVHLLIAAGRAPIELFGLGNSEPALTEHEFPWAGCDPLVAAQIDRRFPEIL